VPEVLITLSAATEMSLTDGTSRAVGFWPEELVEPHRVFTEAGIVTTLATPGGRPAVADPAGLTPEGTGETLARCRELREAVDALLPALRAPAALESLTAERFDAMFIPGGYAPMIDLWADAACGSLIAGFHRADKPIAAVCHGPAALLSYMGPTGQWPFTGYKMTAFSDAEEKDVGLLETIPWTVQQSLTKHGARFLAGTQGWGEHVVCDRTLLTGQNPASAAPLAHRLTAML
jgi:putative intracellular protease/amidase